MKIQYASDLHLEFSANARLVNSPGFLYPVGDVLLLAGDICYLEDKHMENNPFFDWCSEHFLETIIVPGNHEYFAEPGACPLEETLSDFELSVRSNVRYLNNRSYVIRDTEFFATTLWTVACKDSYNHILRNMPDCRAITYKGALFRPEDYREVHQVCREWLTGALAASKAKHKVVLTHHCPTTRPEFCFLSEREGQLFSVFHANDTDLIRESDIDCWIYGHTHYREGSGTALESRKPGGTVLYTNPMGYVEHWENYGFLPDCVIKI